MSFLEASSSAASSTDPIPVKKTIRKKRQPYIKRMSGPKQTKGAPARKRYNNNNNNDNNNNNNNNDNNDNNNNNSTNNNNNNNNNNANNGNDANNRYSFSALRAMSLDYEALKKDKGRMPMEEAL